MPLTPFCIRVESADDLEYYVTQGLAPLLSNKIFGVEIDSSKLAPYFTENIVCAFSYTTGDPVIPTPFILKTFTAQGEAEVLALINQFVAANPTYFVSEAYFFYRTQTPNASQGVSAAVFYNVTFSAKENWAGNQHTGYPSNTGTRPLVAADNCSTLVAIGSPTLTVPAGLPTGFGIAVKATVTFVAGPGVTVNDVRSQGAPDPWCALIQIGPDIYDVVGGKT